MRFAVLFLAVLLGAGAFLYLRGGDLGAGHPTENGTAPITLGPAPVAPSDADVASAEPAGEPESLAEQEVASAEALEEDLRTEASGFGSAKLVNFHGNALLQPKGQTPYPAVRGTIEFAVLNHGRLVPVTATVRQGKFSAEVPDRCLIRIDGGRLEDQTVRFLLDRPQFTLDASSTYALVGEPIPMNRLRVFEGTQRVPLSGVTVRMGTDGSTALMAGAAPVGEVLVENAASPIELPHLPVDHPVWLHVSAQGYATSALLLHPEKANEKDVVLWPSATLTVRVTGPARGRLKALVLHRNEPTGDDKKASKRHFGTFGLNAPGITSDPDAIIFTLENVPALPLTIEARGFDKRGRETRLGSTAVTLGTDQAGRVDLRLENP